MAAGWFYGNTIGPWKEEPYILENVPREHAERISRELLKIHNAQENISTITWKMKRIIITN